MYKQSLIPIALITFLSLLSLSRPSPPPSPSDTRPSLQHPTTIYSSSFTRAIQQRDSNEDDDIVQFSIVRPTPTQATQIRSISSNSTTTIASSQSTENPNDQDVFKLVFTVGSDDSYYNARFQFGDNSQQNNDSDNSDSQGIGLRLDLIQPEVWVMNEDKYKECSEIYESRSSILNQYSSASSIPSSVTDSPLFTTNCAKRGLYTSSETMPAPSGVGDASIYNGDSYIIPYMNQIHAKGQFATDNFNFNLTSGYNFQMSNFTFVNVNDTNVFVGGLGLASYPKGNGFLSRLVQQSIIKSQSYSLWFSNSASTGNESIAQLIPGVVNRKYYVGDLYSVDMIPHTGVRYNSSQDSANGDLANLILPIVNVDNVKIERVDTGESVSIKSDEDEVLPVLLDSRILYSYLPLNVIINLAIQTNAFYSSEANRWLVECDTLTSNGNATIDFVIGSVTVQIPLLEFLVDAVYNGYNLQFENGKKACYLTFLRNDYAGFNSLGLPFLKHIYLVVDNDGKQVALANSNKFLDVDQSELLHLQESDVLPAYNYSSVAPADKNISSIAYIESGTIPFATPMTYANVGNVTTEAITLSYSQVTVNGSETVALDIPARLSGALIRSGSIFVTGVTASSSQGSTQISSSSSGNAPALQVVRIGRKNDSGKLSIWITVVSIFLGIFLAMS
ncbi:YPS7 [Candida margitis]|uniref:YPS7 n=1 Tax=Candida margitis TaxID=1775924 RepID=UPI002226110F|nr:YPS7 [Candida margitis]KAI5970204.1 YPS7 [Candida margitis]